MTLDPFRPLSAKPRDDAQQRARRHQEFSSQGGKFWRGKRDETHPFRRAAHHDVMCRTRHQKAEHQA